MSPGGAITHLVLFRLQPGIGRDDRRLAALVQAMGELPGRIGEIRGWQHGFNTTEDEAAWDYALCARFDSREDLHAYFEHPAHLPVLAAWEEIAQLAFCDINGA